MSGELAVLNYRAGNLASVCNMFKRIGVTASIANTPEDVERAKALVLPGVGAFGYCMGQLGDSGLKEPLLHAVRYKKIPLLGICVGFQMLFSHSEEGNEEGLGLIHGRIVHFDAARLTATQKVPHMGWSEVQVRENHPLFDSVEMPPRFYFVHSYHATDVPPALSIAEANYGCDFTCAVQAENIYGAQFHPEKSHRFGMKFFHNFARIAGVL